jgi:glucose dehydrogenase
MKGFSASALISITLAVLLLPSCGRLRGPQNSRRRAHQDIPGAQPDIHAVSPVSTGQWTTPEGDLGGLRFSTLNQINTGNVKNLHAVVQMTRGIPHGHEGGPLMVNNRMYVVTPYPNFLIAGFDETGWTREMEVQPARRSAIGRRSLPRRGEPGYQGGESEYR